MLFYEFDVGCGGDPGEVTEGAAGGGYYGDRVGGGILYYGTKLVTEVTSGGEGGGMGGGEEGGV